MEFIYIAIAFILIDVVVRMIILPKKRYKNINNLLSNYSSSYRITKVNKEPYDYALDRQDLRILLKVINVPKNSQITINNVSTWKLQWGGDPHRLGRSYPNERYVHEVINFINAKANSDKKTIKIIILYPRTENILRYINESELEIITPEKTPYGYKVTTYDNFEKDFEILTNIK